ncbi:hypothetical protein [Agathobaculum sp.]|uniref:hypothetical protein n=1 Tax=Agathobaculum sp. TaxID=2048138 RepID=UPI002A80D277|nr:hypothetical protein [Agathobaculum sp.]MDY3617752.1 hypothetical protein [Agathobaculum sp.]
MMYRSFTTREKVLLLILALMLVGLAYYMLIQVPVTEQLSALQSEQITAETELIITQARKAQMENMQEELDNAAKQEQAVGVPEYDNQPALLNFLHQALDGTSYTVNFDEADISTQFVRRPASIKFSALNYENAKAVVQALANAPYRCQIGDVVFLANDTGITVQMKITYFEVQMDISDVMSAPMTDELQTLLDEQTKTAA